MAEGRGIMDERRSGTYGQFILRGAIWGIVASLVMALYAMIASAGLGQGFLTPLYGIASPIVGGRDMMASMSMVHVNIGPLLIGAIVHMMWGALYGVVFALLARQFGLQGVTGLIAGAVYGLIVMAIMMYIALPIVGAGGMPQTVGFSFGVEHVIFGVVLGLWPLLRPVEFDRARQTQELATP